MVVSILVSKWMHLEECLSNSNLADGSVSILVSKWMHLEAGNAPAASKIDLCFNPSF